MGNFVFVLLLVGDEASAGHLIFRLSNTIKPKLAFDSTWLARDEDISVGLDRLSV
jgi:hypothetical protein